MIYYFWHWYPIVSIRENFHNLSKRCKTNCEIWQLVWHKGVHLGSTNYRQLSRNSRLVPVLSPLYAFRNGITENNEKALQREGPALVRAHFEYLKHIVWSRK